MGARGRNRAEGGRPHAERGKSYNNIFITTWGAPVQLMQCLVGNSRNLNFFQDAGDSLPTLPEEYREFLNVHQLVPAHGTPGFKYILGTNMNTLMNRPACETPGR